MSKNIVTKNKFNSEIIIKLWRKRNIELCPIECGKGYKNQFRFINEDFTIKSDVIHFYDKDSVIFNCALYAAEYLYDNEAITKEVRDAYENEITKLYNTNYYIQ